MKMKMMFAVAGWMMAMVPMAGAQTTAPVKDDLFAGTEVFAKGATDITEVTMDPDTLGMVGGRDRARASRMVLNIVRTYSYDKPGMYNIADVDAFRNKLNTGDWHCSVHTRSLKTGDSTDVCNKRRTDDLVETAIITVEPKELTFIHTIRKRSPENGNGGGEAFMMPEMFDDGGAGGSWRAQMIISRAQMDAMMAQMRAEGLMQSAGIGPQLRIELNGLKPLDGLKSVRPMDEKELQKLKEKVKPLEKKDLQPVQPLGESEPKP